MEGDKEALGDLDEETEDELEGQPQTEDRETPNVQRYVAAEAPTQSSGRKVRCCIRCRLVKTVDQVHFFTNHTD